MSGGIEQSSGRLTVVTLGCLCTVTFASGLGGQVQQPISQTDAGIHSFHMYRHEISRLTGKITNCQLK